MHPAALPEPGRPDPPRRSLLRARPAWPARIARSWTASKKRTVLIKDGARLTRYTLASHPFDVVGLGRLRLSLHLQRRRFRADHRHRPPAAAGPSDVRCTRFRPLHLRSAAARYASGGDQGAVCPFQCAGRRGALLRSGQIRQPARRRGGMDHAAPAGHSARASPGHDRRQPARDPDR